MPYASTPPPLSIFTLLKRPQDETTMMPSPLLMLPHPRLIFSLANNPYAAVGPSSYAYDAALTPLTPPRTCPTCLQCCLQSLYLKCPPNIPPTLLTILMLVECLPDMPPTPLTILTLAVTSQHAPDTAYHPSRHASNAAYHPYACIVPS
ncbi:hypothetical protein O181_032393 [Austropuccinia psidii MF-1]|uniref:Uncharacterized protein n=1 Tax=Austropuccinia psidii MF-1 TaxID=1389203 RepID=A0A9Q3CZD3_9BASI|nr:hypothetical protein [Austropuccinia psidii MF-1]